MKLDELSPDQFRRWLRDALHDRVPLPKLTPDEPPDLAILRIEPELDRLTRRDLSRACVDLVRDFATGSRPDFTTTSEGTEDYVRSLLHLAAGLGLRDEISAELVAMARRFPEHKGLSPAIRRVVLQAFVALRAVLPQEFWHEMLAQDADTFAGPALSGLLATSFSAGLALLPRLPERPSLALAAASILDRALEELPPAHRTPCLRELQEVLVRCSLPVRRALAEVLRQYAPDPPHTAIPHPRLVEALGKYPRSRAVLGQPHSARLVA